MPATTKPRSLVWGACGFIGRSLVPALLQAGHEVSVLTRARSKYSLPKWSDSVRWIEADGTSSANKYLEAIRDADVVYNLAGVSGAVVSNQRPLESLDGNCRVQLEFLEACRIAGNLPHVVFASSRLVYGAVNRLPVDELSPAAPSSMYAAHKLCVEQYHQIYHSVHGAITYTVCRISNPFGLSSCGTGKGYGVINSMIQRAMEGGTLSLFGDGSQVRDYLFIDDLVRALLLCGTNVAARNQLFNIGSGVGVSMLQAAETICEMVGRGDIRFQGWPAEYSKVETGDFVADIRKFSTATGFSPRYSLVAGLKQGLEQQLPTAPEMKSRLTLQTALGN